jgi:hypothetical protein
LKRIYQTSRGWLELEGFATFDSRELWLTFFDEDGWVRHRVSWGSDAFQQPDFDLPRQILGRLLFEGFPEAEAERLADQMREDVRRSRQGAGRVAEWCGTRSDGAGSGAGLGGEKCAICRDVRSLPGPSSG